MTLGMITRAMLKNHEIINNLLGNFEKEKDSNKARDLFDIFKWNLEKHFFVEEENVFNATDKDNKTEFLGLKNLLRDHRDLRTIAEDIYEDIAKKRKPNVSILRELLIAHERRETEFFYPRLDERLSQKEKEKILDKVGEISLG